MTNIFEKWYACGWYSATFLKHFNFSSEKRVGVEMKIELECWYLKNRATR